MTYKQCSFFLLGMVLMFWGLLAKSDINLQSCQKQIEDIKNDK